MEEQVVRGGSWDNFPWSCRSACRVKSSPNGRFINIGFRIVCEIKTDHMDILNLGNDIVLELAEIPAGVFMMGSPNTESYRYPDEGSQHKVTVPAFLMGKYQVTQAQYQSVMGKNPSLFKGKNRPVERVTWKDAVTFCKKLSKKTGRKFRLPTEAEWEYACRAGTTTPYCFGESLKNNQANYNFSTTTDVGSFPPNGFGLYDMHGNVWEWCQDHWHDNYKGAPTDGSAWVCDGISYQQVMRGGSVGSFPWECRSAFRSYDNPNGRFNNIGFRVVSNGLSEAVQ